MAEEDTIGKVLVEAAIARAPRPRAAPDRLPKKGTGARAAPVYGELLTFDDPEDPPHGHRPAGKVPVFASAAAFGSPSAQIESSFRLGSMWDKGGFRADLGPCAAPAGRHTTYSAKFGQIGKTKGQND